MKNGLSVFGRHKEKWKTCQLCGYANTRRKVVLYRGAIPCDVLFIGEAPGKSENLLGKPFVGEAGKLLDYIIATALESVEDGSLLRLGFTNLVGCIPVNEDDDLAPTKKCISTCSQRLNEILDMNSESTLIAVGSLSKKHTRYDYHITHPAAILRADPAMKSMEVQRTVVKLREVFSTTLANKPPF